MRPPHEVERVMAIASDAMIARHDLDTLKVHLRDAKRRMQSCMAVVAKLEGAVDEAQVEAVLKSDHFDQVLTDATDHCSCGHPLSDVDGGRGDRREQ